MEETFPEGVTSLYVGTLLEAKNNRPCGRSPPFHEKKLPNHRGALRGRLDLRRAAAEHFRVLVLRTQSGDERGNTEAAKSAVLRGCPRNCERRA